MPGGARSGAQGRLTFMYGMLCYPLDPGSGGRAVLMFRIGGTKRPHAVPF